MAEAALSLFLAERLTDRFKREHGRDPTDAEKQEMTLSLESNVDFAADDGADEETAAALVLEQICNSFVSANGRMPTEKELKQVHAKLKAKTPELKGVNGDEEQISAYLLGRLKQRFHEENGREPNADEIAALERQLVEEVSMVEPSTSSNAASVAAKTQADEDEARAEALVMAKVRGSFFMEHHRAPTEDELEEVLTKMKQAAPALKEAAGGSAPAQETPAAAAPAPAAAPATADNGTQEGSVLQQLCEMFKAEKGRDPTEFEMKQWMKQIGELNADVAGSAEPAEDAGSSSSTATAGKGKKRAAPADVTNADAGSKVQRSA